MFMIYAVGIYNHAGEVTSFLMRYPQEHTLAFRETVFSKWTSTPDAQSATRFSSKREALGALKSAMQEKYFGTIIEAWEDDQYY